MEAYLDSSLVESLQSFEYRLLVLFVQEAHCYRKVSFRHCFCGFSSFYTKYDHFSFYIELLFEQFVQYFN